MSDLIHSVSLHLHASNRASATVAQEEASRAFRDDIPAALEGLFNTRPFAGAAQRIDHLELDLGSLPSRGFRQAFVAKLVQTLAQLEDHSPAPGADSFKDAAAPSLSGTIDRIAHATKSPGGSHAEAFLHFMKTGALPWWFSLSRWHAEVPSALLSDAAFGILREKLAALMRQRPSRLFRLLSFPEIIVRLFHEGLPAITGANVFTTSLEGLPEALRLRVRLVLWFLNLAAAKNTAEATRSILQRLLQVGPPPHSRPGRLHATAAALEKASSFGTATASGGTDGYLRLSASYSELLAFLSPPEATGPIPSKENRHPVTRNKPESVDPEQTAPPRDSSKAKAPEPGEESIASPLMPEAPDPEKGKPFMGPKGERTPAPPEPREEMPPSDGEFHASEGLHTHSAGMVLLHPFIPRFFKHRGWLDDRQQLLSNFQWHAVQALHVLARNRPARDEGELVLEKTLCGIGLEEAGDLPELEGEVLEEIQLLLGAVITHWQAIRNTSAEGLQEAFLDRPGLLYLTEHPRIHVESRPYDMLLTRLPWSLNRLVFPWLRAPVEIHWASLP